MPTPLKSEPDGRVLRLTLARPDRRNALNNELCQALLAALREPAGAILIDAEGPTFCAGMDLDDATPASTAIHAELFTIGYRTRTPIVTAIQGPALGGGLGIVANAHVAIAAQGAQFGLTEVRVGMWPFVIWPAISRALGERRARMLALTARIFGSTEALSWGLVHEVVPPVELEDRALAVAHQLAESSPTAIEEGLGMIADGAILDEARRSVELRAPVMNSPDFAEGIAAFREKRKPIWPSIL
ncbi:MAG: enoyl-CoA hydratase-related protein [Bryobacteraceae bacterium]|nr:enoyl-CoA hydratase-related protein [Bryobacteraceae bacterium]